MIIGSIITAFLLALAYWMWRSSNELYNSVDEASKSTDNTNMGIPDVSNESPAKVVNNQITDSVTTEKPKARKSATKKPATKKSSTESGAKTRKKKSAN